MKRIIVFLMGALMSGSLIARDPTNFPEGLSTYDTATQVRIASTTETGVPADGDLWVSGDLNVAGNVNATGSNGILSSRDEFINVPTADSDTLKTPTGSLVISTNVLVSKTSCFVDLTYFTLNKYARPITTMFDNSIASVTITGTFNFTGIDSCGISRYESMSILTTTVSVSNYAYFRITQSTLTVVSAPGLSGEASGSLSLYGDTSKLYPRFGVDVGIGLTGHPFTNAVDWIAEQDTQKLPSTAIVFSSNAVIRFGSAPNGSMDYETTYKLRGNR